MNRVEFHHDNDEHSCSKTVDTELDNIELTESKTDATSFSEDIVAFHKAIPACRCPSSRCARIACGLACVLIILIPSLLLTSPGKHVRYIICSGPIHPPFAQSYISLEDVLPGKFASLSEDL